MKPLELTFRFVIGILCIALFILSIVWIAKKNSNKNLEYPEITKTEAVQGQIESIEIERSFVRIGFVCGLKRSIYFARNTSYTPADITEFSQRGDRFTKSANSDTIRIIRGGVSYVFVLGKEVRCCKE